MLTAVYEIGQWPAGVKEPMKRYYKREYPEFFANGKRAEHKRDEQQRKAAELKANKRPSRSKPKKPVPTQGPDPIDIRFWQQRSGPPGA